MKRYQANRLRASLLPIILTLLSIPALVRGDGPPTTLKKPVVHRYHHGETVTDPYQWLEDIDAKETKAWVQAQNEYSAQHIADLPALNPLEGRLSKNWENAPSFYSDLQIVDKVILAIRDGELVVLKSLEEPKVLRVLVNPLTFLPGKEVEIDYYYLSNTGKYVVVSISPEGLEDATAHIYETATGKKLPDVIPQVGGPPGGDLTWNTDDTGLYYTYYPYATLGGKPSARRYACQEIRFHRLGDSIDKDSYVCGDTFPRYPQCMIIPCFESEHRLIMVDQGDNGSSARFYLQVPQGGVTQLIKPEDGVIDAAFLSKSTLFLFSVKDAPRGQFLTCSFTEKGLEKAKVLIPHSDWLVSTWTMTDNLIWVLDQKDGVERMRMFNMEGQLRNTLTLPPFTTISSDSLTPLAEDVLLYRTEGYIQAPQWQTYNPTWATPKPTALTGKWDVSFPDIEIVRETATAKDGAMIPMTIIRPKKCPLDGKRPTLIHVYGGSKIRDEPIFDPDSRVWFDHGGIVVYAHPRGSGELDENAYRQTLQGKKRVTAEDVNACTEHLIARKYTNPEKIGITGSSFGGLVVGLAVTQRPDLYGAAIADGGVYDVLRMSHEPFGPHLAFEQGRINDRKHFREMRSSSPYEQVKPKTNYPAVWLRTGDHDRRCMPWQSWKMVARLQAAGSKKPILLSTEPNVGHNYWWPMEEDMAFYFKHLGIEYQPAKGKVGEKVAP